MSDAGAAVPLLEEPKFNQWRPVALRKSALISFIGVCVGLLITSELVTFGCKRNDGCYVFGSSTDGNLPTLSTLVYRGIPTLLGIVLSLRWYVAHHDIIRLEPYYQMSTENGAKASNSLFLQYSYDLVIALPFKALMKGHYIVALSSSTLFVMNFGIVPLVGRAFDIGITSSSIFGNASRVEFNPMAHQVAANFTFSAYDYAWKGGALAPFMTAEYALLPVKSLDTFPVFLPSENWTIETTLFEADLECANANRVNFNRNERPGNTALTLDIFEHENSSEPVRVCDALAMEQEDASYENICDDMAAFITPWASVYMLLPEERWAQPTYLAVWASGPSSPPNITANFTSPDPIDYTAIFCTPKYYTQAVSATVSMPLGKVDGIYRIGEREEMKPLQGFDNILKGQPHHDYDGEALFVERPGRDGATPVPHVRFGYPPDKVVDLKHDLLEKFGEASRPAAPVGYSSASKSNIFMSNTNMLFPFALYSKKNESAELQRLLDPKDLESTIKKALKLWFAFAVASESARGKEPSATIPVERKVPRPKITVNPYWSLGARMGLPLVMVLAALLIYLAEKRPCHLNAEPNTMDAALRLLSVSPALCAAMQHAEYYPLATLMEELDKRGLYFRMGQDKEGSPQIRVFCGEGDKAEEVLESSEALKIFLPSNAAVQKDIEFISPDLIAIAAILLFPILIAALICTNEMSKKKDGLPMPGDPNSFWSGLFYGYVPTTFGTATEALLILLGTTQCMVSPYKILRKGNARYKEAIKVDYDRIPPHFQLVHSFRSFRSSHSLKPGQYTLVVLSVAILISNALSIVMSSMFSPTRHVPMIPKKSHSPLTGFPLARQEIFFQLNRNITSDYSPSWTTSEYYIDSPFEIAPVYREDTYKTRGFGVDVHCTVVPEDRITFPCTASALSRNVSVPGECHDHPDDDNIMFVSSPCGGTEVPIVVFWNGTFTDYIASEDNCPDRIFPIWAQNDRYTVDKPFRTATGYQEGYLFGLEDKYEFVVLNCSIADRIADLRATVNSDGRVISVADETRVELDKNTTLSLARSFIDVLKGLIEEFRVQGNYPLERINWLMAQVDGVVVRSNDTHVPSVEVAADTFAEVLKRLFPLLVRLYAWEIFGVKYIVDPMEYRARIVVVSFGVALGVLVFCFCVVVNVYVNHLRKMEGHLPWSLAGLYSHLYASNAKDDAIRGGEGQGDQVRPPGVYTYGGYPEELRLGKHYGVYRHSGGK